MPEIPEPGDRAAKWLEEVIDHVGLPSFARNNPVNLGYMTRRCWVWFLNGENHNLAIEQHGARFKVVSGGPGRRCELWTDQEPTDEEVRTACRFVALLPTGELLGGTE